MCTEKTQNKDKAYMTKEN